jgi:hypothetical protein
MPCVGEVNRIRVTMRDVVVHLDRGLINRVHNSYLLAARIPERMLSARAAQPRRAHLLESTMTSRRRFISISLAAAAGTLTITGARADSPLVDEKDPAAVNLGYVSDATKANKAKYPRYAAGQKCAVCALYQGKPGASSGPCPLFAGKQVTANGWCSAFAPKA